MNTEFIKSTEVMGLILATFRKQRDLEQTDIAKCLGITQASWSRVEGGKAVINLAQLEASCSILNIDLVFLSQTYLNICELLKSKGITIIFIGLKISDVQNYEKMSSEVKEILIENIKLCFMKNESVCASKQISL